MLEQLRKIAARYHEIDELLARPEVASDPTRSTALLRERGRIAKIVDRFHAWQSLANRRADAEQILKNAVDPDLGELARAELAELARLEPPLVEELKGLLVADDPDDDKDVIIEIRAGEGGDEASLFASDLYRMYSRWADRSGFRTEVLASNASEVRGFKEISFAVHGDGAFRRLKHESGGHRVQRVPETEQQGRIHTSLATVAVLPEAEDVEISVKDEDLKVDTFRSGGPGGQNVNKTSSAVRLTHLPSGMVVVCQDESSQHKNRAKALRVLRARLHAMEETKRRTERDHLRRTQVGSGERSERIRTYNFPQGRVTDHRLKQNYNVDRVIEGDLDELLDDLRRAEIEAKLQDLDRNRPQE